MEIPVFVVTNKNNRNFTKNKISFLTSKSFLSFPEGRFFVVWLIMS